MPTRSKIPYEVGCVFYPNRTAVYMSDGRILVDRGFGYKLWAVVKKGWTVKMACWYANLWESLRLSNQEYFTWSQLLQSVLIEKRWQLIALVQNMPNDPASVATAARANKIQLNLDEAEALCELYKILIRKWWMKW